MRKLLLLAMLLIAARTPVAAQDVEEGYFVVMDFAKAKTSAPVSSERAVWMPFWQAMADAGHRESWTMYQVWWGFDQGKYTHVWVHTARTLADLNVSTAVWDSLWTVAHPDTNVDSLQASWSDRFDFVKSELLYVSASVGDWHGDMLAAAYMRTPVNGDSEYLAVEREIWQPVMKESVSDGTRNGWSILSVRWPGGTDYPYGHLALNSYPSFEMLGGSIPMTEYFTRAHPGMDLDALSDRTLASRDIVRTELWQRVLHVH